VTEDHRREVPESVFINVKVSAAHPAITDLDFNLIVAATRLFDLPQLDVTDPRLILDQSFHDIYL
jgi:hypothetical protein